MDSKVCETCHWFRRERCYSPESDNLGKLMLATEACEDWMSKGGLLQSFHTTLYAQEGRKEKECGHSE